MNHTALRNLAKCDKWQSIYNNCKEIASLSLFYNNKELTKLQIWFLYYLGLYQSLYIDLNSGEDFISSEVIEDPIRVDAYILYRIEKRKKNLKSKDLDNNNQVKSTGGLPSVKFINKVK